MEFSPAWWSSASRSPQQGLIGCDRFRCVVCVQEPSARVVGFKVEPFSVKHVFQSPAAYWTGAPGDMPPLSTCDKDNFIDPVKPTVVRVGFS